MDKCSSFRLSFWQYSLPSHFAESILVYYSLFLVETFNTVYNVFQSWSYFQPRNDKKIVHHRFVLSNHLMKERLSYSVISPRKRRTRNFVCTVSIFNEFALMFSHSFPSATKIGFSATMLNVISPDNKFRIFFIG